MTSALADPLPTRSYGYDPSGNINGITRDLPGGPEAHIFGYDLMDRLASWEKPGRSQVMIYDANGNRQSFTDNSDYTGYSYDPVAKNILIGSYGAESVAYSTDALGNVSGRGTTTLVHEINGKLSSVEEGGTPLGEYVYNVDGQRARKVAAGQATYFEYDAGGRLIHEYRSDEGVAVDYVYLEGEPLAMLVSDDIQGSSVVAPVPSEMGTFTPSSGQNVAYGQRTTFTVVPNYGYHLVGVSGCGGTLIGDTYTTGPITGDCAIIAEYAPNNYTVTVSAGPNGSVSPTGVQLVVYQETVSFTLLPDDHYHVVDASGCGGSLEGNIYTTGPIVGNCTIMVSYAPDITTVRHNFGLTV